MRATVGSYLSRPLARNTYFVPLEVQDAYTPLGPTSAMPDGDLTLIAASRPFPLRKTSDFSGAPGDLVKWHRSYSARWER